jgi:hypothetical protein
MTLLAKDPSMPALCQRADTQCKPQLHRDDTLAIDVLHKSLADGFPDGPRR